MIALYIILGVVILITLLLLVSAGVDFRYSPDEFTVKIIAGPLRIKVIPSQKKKKSYKKLTGELKNKKISELEFHKAQKKKKEKNENKKKLKFGRTGETVNDFISAVSEMSDDPEALRFLLISLKKLAESFNKALRISIKSLKADIDAGNAAKSCILSGALSGFITLAVEFLDINSKLTPIRENAISVAPTFDGTGYKFDVSFSVKVRLFWIIKAFIASFTENIKFQKHYTTIKEKTKK